MSNFVQVIKACKTASLTAKAAEEAFAIAMEEYKANGKVGEKPEKPAGPKELIRAALSGADPIAQRLIYYALDYHKVFGIKKFDMPKTETAKGLFDMGDPYENFFNLLDALVARDLTGNAARQAITAALADFPLEDREYLGRVIDKDLKGGFSAETYNKIFHDDTIPVYDCMLADKCEDTEDFEKYVNFPCQADFKYDGERTQAFVYEDAIVYLSRSGKEAFHLAGLFDDDLRKIRNHLGYDCVVDGERISDVGFTDTVNAKKSGNDAAKANLRLRAFFYMSIAEWEARKCDRTMQEARNEIGEMITTLGLQKIILTEGREVMDYSDMMNFCNDAIDLPENAARKIEGLILKDWNATYNWDRTFAWTKVKRFYDIDCRIVGFAPGKPKSRLADTVGKVYCIGFLESGERVQFKIGSGFNDADRADMKANPEKWLNATIVGKYQEVCSSKSKKFRSLRFCTFEHIRDDKHVDISDIDDIDLKDFE